VSKEASTSSWTSASTIIVLPPVRSGAANLPKGDVEALVTPFASPDVRRTQAHVLDLHQEVVGMPACSHIAPFGAPVEQT